MIVCTLSFDKLHEVSSLVKAVIYTRVYAFVYGYFRVGSGLQQLFGSTAFLPPFTVSST